MPSPWDSVRTYAEKSERLVVGLMSGTSVDGVDVALVRISGSGRSTRVEQLAFYTHPYPFGLRAEVLRLSNGEGSTEDISQAHVAIGHLFSQAVDALLRRVPNSGRAIDLIASHGQTVSHTPLQGPRARVTSGRYGATLQIGDPSVIAQKIGVPVVSNFRSADVAAGGQGAPLVPYADWCLLTDPQRTRAIQNIGGIANVTYLPADARAEQVIGFDTGPGNMLIDRAVVQETRGQSTYDRDGWFARQGSIHFDILESLLNDPFLLQPPPKSAGREQFGEAFFQRLLAAAPDQDSWLGAFFPYDAVATLTAFTAYSIADAYERFLPQPPDEVIIGGGGARNPVLLKMLRERLAPARVLTHEDVGINSDAKEAIAFAVLGNETMLGNPSNLPSVTGASRPVALGQITLP